MDYSNETFLFAIKPILAKSRDWKYEKEVRCVYSLSQKHPRIHEGKDKNGKKDMAFRHVGKNQKNLYWLRGQ